MPKSAKKKVFFQIIWGLWPLLATGWLRPCKETNMSENSVEMMSINRLKKHNNYTFQPHIGLYFC